MNKIAAIIQARMGSSRLPKKVLAKIEGKPMLWHQVNRLKQSKFSPEIIIATSNLEQDKPILDLANQLNVKSYAGSHEDVLDRYYQASLINKIDIIVRITADCPLLDSEVFDKVLNTFLEGDYDYVSNVRPATYPDGLDVEVFSFVTLKKTWNNARLSSEREHVTGYIATHLNEFKTLQDPLKLPKHPATITKNNPKYKKHAQELHNDISHLTSVHQNLTQKISIKGKEKSISQTALQNNIHLPT